MQNTYKHVFKDMKKLWITLWITWWNKSEKETRTMFEEDIHKVICEFLERFTLIFDRKRYKLIKFAPKMEIVDK